MDLLISSFSLKIEIDNKVYALEVGQTYLSESKEVFTLVYGKRKIEIQSNRPLLRGKELNKKKIEWKVINGNVKYYSSLEKIIQELDNYIKKIEKPSFDWATHPKNQPY